MSFFKDLYLDLRETLVEFLNFTFLINIKLYRKIVGGNWERWYVDSPICGYVWFHSSECELTKFGGRPSVLCRGCPEIVEWYEIKNEINKLIGEVDHVC